MEPTTLAFLAAAGFVAAFVDSIVGGGGAITIPALLAAGLPPHLALGTNKLAATSAALSASVRYATAGLVHARLVLIAMPLAVVGSVAGARTVLEIEPVVIETLVIVVMAAMTVYVVARKRFGLEDRFAGLTRGRTAGMAALALAIGFYDGLLGPGTGSFLLFALVGVLGFDFLRAAANGRLINLASNAGALGLFVWAGKVDYAAGLTMAAAMVVGGWSGSHFGIRRGAAWIKPLFVVVTVVLMVRLLVFS